MLQKLLVPIDFSENSAIAAAQAAALARKFQSQVTLFHVAEFPAARPLSGPMGFGIASSEAVRMQHLSEQKKRLDDFAVPEFRDLAVKRILCCGDPASLIVQRAREERSDLILISTHGHGVFRRLLLGSVTAKVLHDAECPVWTSTHHPEPAARAALPGDQVMCAASFGPESAESIRWAAAYAEACGARLTLVHAVLDNPPNLPERYMFQWHEEAHWGAEERLRLMLRDLDVKAEPLVISDGDIPKALSASARDKGAGLLVIGRSCAGRAARPLGTHTYSIICNAPCPVVTV